MTESGGRQLNGMSKLFVIGDIHGAYRALRQCLDRSGFDYGNDHLICLGDVCDGWPETKDCIDELLKIKELTYVMGNHDFWASHWMNTGDAESVWLSQGGDATVKSYMDMIPTRHREFLAGALPYFLSGNTLFVHGGIDTQRSLDEQGMTTFLWDRSLAAKALELTAEKGIGNLTTFDEVYIGHTPIPYEKPILSGGVWLMDTGAGWDGVLSMMDVKTKEIFTSDKVPELYPGVAGRKRKY